MTGRSIPAHRAGARPLRAAVLAAALALLAAATGCHEAPADRVFTAEDTTIFVPSGTPADPDTVLLRGEVIDNRTILLDVVLAGPSASGDLYSFAFDLAFSGEFTPQYVADSIEAGPALTEANGQTVVAQAKQDGDRITIGVTKTGGGAGNGVGAGETSIARLRLTLPDPGRVAIAFAPNRAGNDPAALDSTGAVIPSVRFDSQPATIDRPL